MLILGLNHDMYISSAALLSDGEVLAAASEERFNRQKHSRSFPVNAINHCLAQAGASIEDVSAIATAWNPGVYMNKFNPLVSSQRRFKSEYLYAVPDNLMSLYPASERVVEHVHQRLVLAKGECNIHHVTHHRAHAANAFLFSPFDEAAILTADSQGEVESTTLSIGQGHRIQLLASQPHPHSLGAFYATFTEYLGFRPHSDEWKVMALSAYAGKSAEGLYRRMRDEMVEFKEQGGFALNLRYFKDFLHEQPRLFTSGLEALLGPARGHSEELGERHFAIAAAMQQLAEELTFHIARDLHKRTNSKNLCVAGGFFMNAVINGKLLEQTPFENLFISSCPDDSGNSLGAAAYLYNHVMDHKERTVMRHNYLGPGFDNAAIAEALSAAGLEAEHLDDVEAVTAGLLAQGALVGWFQGRMEFGQRALGNRSILADPRDPKQGEKINRAVKFREEFRPFAPAVLAERAGDYFQLLAGMAVPFMEKIYPVRPEKRGEIPAVVHADGSARLQTVEAESNPRFYGLLSRFCELTGVPVLLNTSFNLNGEPVVCTPTDAIRTFHSCGLNVLVLGDWMLRKPRWRQ